MRSESEVTQILKQELEALEMNSSFFLDKTAKEKRAFAITALRAALAEATIKNNLTVEPVAWMTKYEELAPRFHRTEEHATGWGSEPIPLYTAPPKREPLTDEEIGAVAADIWGSILIAPQSYQQFARAIERAHGIGGEE